MSGQPPRPPPGSSSSVPPASSPHRGPRRGPPRGPPPTPSAPPPPPAPAPAPSAPRPHPDTKYRIHYMRPGVTYRIYQEIAKRGSLESKVNGFWTTVLSSYFTLDLEYSIMPQRQQNHPAKETRADITIQLDIANSVTNALCTVMILESKRRDYEGTSWIWKGALEELTEYLKSTWETEHNNKGPLYGAVAIGRYIRFYVLRNQNDLEMQDYNGDPDVRGNHIAATQEGKPWEAKKNVQEIHEILQDILTKTQQMR